MMGDELRLKYLGELHKPWSGVGHVIKIDTLTNEVTIELKSNANVPSDCTINFVTDFVWKSTSFDRYNKRILALLEHLILVIAS